ncbi:MAG: hydrolase [Thermoguttaceae bacterium]
MSTTNAVECCPRFNPEPWDDKTIPWENKRFVKDRVVSILHMPLNFGAVMKRNVRAIEAAGGIAADMIVLADENSLWGADVYIEVTKDIPGANMATISGTFISKVFEGPYRNVRKWIEEMKGFVTAKGKNVRKLYFYYTTCPKCAKKFGKNYVVILAQT